MHWHFYSFPINVTNLYAWIQCNNMLFYTCCAVFNVHWHSRAQKIESCTLTCFSKYCLVVFWMKMLWQWYCMQSKCWGHFLIDWLESVCVCVFSRSWRCWTIKNLLLDSLLHLQTRFCYRTSPAWWRERSGDERWKLDRGREVRESEIYE